MSDTTFSDPVNRQRTDLPTLNPVEHEELLAAAVDGRDYQMIALLVLDHPFSKFLPKWFLEELGAVAVLDGVEHEEITTRRVLAAGNVFLRGGRAS